MNIKEIIKGKKEWRAHMARVKALPEDYQIVYKEIQKYLYKVGPVELTEGISILSGIVDLFEEGVASQKRVLEVTGHDVASFCDELIKDSKTYADIYQSGMGPEVAESIDKYLSRKDKKDKKNKKETL